METGEAPTELQFGFSDGGGVSRHENGIYDVRLVVDPLSVSLVGGEPIKQPVTITIPRASVRSVCSESNGVEVDLHVRPLKGLPYFKSMYETANGWEVVFGADTVDREGKVRHEAEDITDICRYGGAIDFSMRRVCNDENRDGASGRLIAHLGCYKGKVALLGDPSGIIDKPGPSSVCTPVAKQKVLLIQIPSWTPGATNNNKGNATNPDLTGVCYEKSMGTPVAWHSVSQAGSAPTEIPSSGVSPGSEMTTKSDGAYGFSGMPDTCYYVYVKNGTCEYFSDVVSVPPLASDPTKPDPTEEITGLDLHIPSGSCGPAATCP